MASSYVGAKIVHQGDLVFNKLKAHLGVFAISNYDGLVSPDYAVYTPTRMTILPYLELLLRTQYYITEFQKKTTGVAIGLTRLYTSGLFSISAIYPPLSEQQRIVNFLETKTKKIDQYIAEKEKQVQLLEEYKQTLIANAVTKGLNKNVKMKDSGIPWIGMIPEHWEVKKLSQACCEHFISNKNVHHQNLLSLSYGKIIRKDINTTDGLLPASFDTYQIVEPKNIILRLTDLQNDHKSLRVGIANEEGIITSAYVCISLYNTDYIPQYIYNILHSYDIKKLFYSLGGGLRQNLNWQGLKKIDIPLPSKDEQEKIVSYIEEKCSKVDFLISDLETEITHIKEFKQRLIADCVTGQIKV